MGKVFSHPLFIIAFCLVCVVIVIGLRKTSEKTDLSAQTIEKLETEVAQVATEVTDLRTEAAFSQTDFAKEQIARNELLLQKPGEYVIQVVKPESTQEVVAEKETKLSPWDEWKRVLFE